MASRKELNDSSKNKMVVKLCASELPFLGKCPHCRGETPMPRGPFPRIFDALEKERIRAGDEGPNCMA